MKIKSMHLRMLLVKASIIGMVLTWNGCDTESTNVSPAFNIDDVKMVNLDNDDYTVARYESTEDGVEVRIYAVDGTPGVSVTYDYGANMEKIGPYLKMVNKYHAGEIRLDELFASLNHGFINPRLLIKLKEMSLRNRDQQSYDNSFYTLSQNDQQRLIEKADNFLRAKVPSSKMSENTQAFSNGNCGANLGQWFKDNYCDIKSTTLDFLDFPNAIERVWYCHTGNGPAQSPPITIGTLDTYFVFLANPTDSQYNITSYAFTYIGSNYYYITAKAKKVVYHEYYTKNSRLTYTYATNGDERCLGICLSIILSNGIL